MVWLVVCGTALPAFAQFSPLQITVQRITKKTDTGERHEAQGSATIIYAGDYSANMALRITVRNTTTKPFDGLTLRWGIVKSQVIGFRQGGDVAYGGEQPLDLKPTEVKVIETDVVSASGKRFADGDARGERLRGHGVQILRDGKVIAEEFVPPTTKKAFEALKPVGSQDEPAAPAEGKKTKGKKDK